jgi:predicted DNA-binding antitoxin AbrB/MazE fold protein
VSCRLRYRGTGENASKATASEITCDDRFLKTAAEMSLQLTWADHCDPFTEGKSVMAITIDAIYENGVLKPAEALPLKEHQKVRVTIESEKEPTASPPDEAELIVRRSYGLIGWTGDVETLRRVAEDPEFGLLESP